MCVCVGGAHMEMIENVLSQVLVKKQDMLSPGLIL